MSVEMSLEGPRPPNAPLVGVMLLAVVPGVLLVDVELVPAALEAKKQLQRRYQTE